APPGGAISIAGAGVLNVTPAWSNSSTLSIATGGVVMGGNVTNNATVAGSGTISALLVNAGLLSANAGTLSLLNAPTIQGGGISITGSGVLNDAPAWRSSGTLSIAAGGALTGGTLTNTSATGMLGGRGVI